MFLKISCMVAYRVTGPPEVLHTLPVATMEQGNGNINTPSPCREVSVVTNAD